MGTKCSRDCVSTYFHTSKATGLMFFERLVRLFLEQAEERVNSLISCQQSIYLPSQEDLVFLKLNNYVGSFSSLVYLVLEKLFT